jgi:hypothetical protein
MYVHKEVTVGARVMRRGMVKKSKEDASFFSVGISSNPFLSTNTVTMAASYFCGAGRGFARLWIKPVRTIVHIIVPYIAKKKCRKL